MFVKSEQKKVSQVHKREMRRGFVALVSLKQKVSCSENGFSTHTGDFIDQKDLTRSRTTNGESF